MQHSDFKDFLEKLGAPEDLRQLCQASVAKAEKSGERLKAARESLALPQKAFAELLGISRRGLQDMEAQKNVPSGQSLAALMGLGINANWVLTGEGPDLLKSLQDNTSQALRPDELRLAVQLTEEALEGGKLSPSDYAELLTLIYDALVHGLPSAQVIALARPAARGIKGGTERNVKPAVGRTG